MIGSFRKLPSDSSDSITAHSPLPSCAVFFNEFITPPFITVGSNLASSKIFATNDVVVVLPCEPVITMFFFRATMPILNTYYAKPVLIGIS